MIGWALPRKLEEGLMSEAMAALFGVGDSMSTGEAKPGVSGVKL